LDQEDQLISQLTATLAADAGNAGAWSTLGAMLRRRGRLEEAIACHRRGVELMPWNAGIWTNLGNALLDAHRLQEALEAHDQAVALAPDDVMLRFNRIVALRQAGRFHEALAAMDSALQHEPATPRLLWERALARLQIGDYVGGLQDYEARWQLHADRLPPRRGRSWSGEPLDGKTILLSTEQGFGDSLLAARYVPLVRARGGRILFECHAELRRLLAGLEVEALVAPGSVTDGFDFQAAQMSLPGLCGTTAASIPPPVRVTIPEQARAKAARVLGRAEPGVLRVGIVWSGRTSFADNRRRATTLTRFLRFAEVPGVRLYSLQKGPPETELASLASGRQLIVPLGEHLEDFADTAAFLEQLDLVIMTDSAVAHLAGAMGRPIWNLLQHVPYWIYGSNDDHTPWYPSMRLFRQSADGTWNSVFTAAADALAVHALSHAGAGA